MVLTTSAETGTNLVVEGESDGKSHHYKGLG
jgi:hypothetical protein